MSRLTADSIGIRFGPRFALSDVYLDFGTSEIIGLVGRNGCGKTTLLRVLGGQAVASGVVKVDGAFVAPRDRWQHVAFLPQRSFLPRDLTVRAAARLFLGTAGVDIVMEDSRLGLLAIRKVGDLSAGERRLLEFHLVMGLNRRFVFMDEPFSQVEPIHVQAMLASIKAQAGDRAFVLTDHDHWSIREVCTRLYSLDDGVLRSMGREDLDLKRAGYLPDTAIGGSTRGATPPDERS